MKKPEEKKRFERVVIDQLREDLALSDDSESFVSPQVRGFIFLEKGSPASWGSEGTLKRF